MFFSCSILLHVCVHTSCASLLKICSIKTQICCFCWRPLIPASLVLLFCFFPYVYNENTFPQANDFCREWRVFNKQTDTDPLPGQKYNKQIPESNSNEERCQMAQRRSHREQACLQASSPRKTWGTKLVI